MQQHRSQHQNAGSRGRSENNFRGNRGRGQGMRQGQAQNLSNRRNEYGEEFGNNPRESSGEYSDYNAQSWGESPTNPQWTGSSDEAMYERSNQNGLNAGAYRGEIEGPHGRGVAGGAYRPGQDVGSYGSGGDRGTYRGGFYGGDVQGGYGGRGTGMQNQRDFSQRWDAEQQRYGFEENGISTEMGQSSYGKGPKGYKRSDERMKEDLCERIAQLHGVDASDVEVQVGEAEVTLTGTVPDRHMKYQLEHAAFDIFGVQDVNNRLKIKREPVTLPASTNSGSTAVRSNKTSSGASSAPLPGAHNS